MWWHMPVIHKLWRWRQDQEIKIIVIYVEFKVSLAYTRSCLNETKQAGQRDGSASQDDCCQAKDLSSVPGTQTAEGDPNPHELFYDLHMTMACVCTYSHRQHSSNHDTQILSEPLMLAPMLLGSQLGFLGFFIVALCFYAVALAVLNLTIQTRLTLTLRHLLASTSQNYS